MACYFVIVEGMDTSWVFLWCLWRCSIKDGGWGSPWKVAPTCKMQRSEILVVEWRYFNFLACLLISGKQADPNWLNACLFRGLACVICLLLLSCSISYQHLAAGTTHPGGDDHLLGLLKNHPFRMGKQVTERAGASLLNQLPGRLNAFRYNPINSQIE